MRTIAISAAGLVGLLLVASIGGAAVSVAGDSARAEGPNATSSGQAENCAQAPPGDFADPDGDVLGWEEGYWGNESIDVTRSDGYDQSEIRTVVARTMARVESIRCLEFEERVPVRVIDRSTFEARERGRNTTGATRTFDNAKYEALFLVNESADSIAVQRANTASNVLGFYDDRSERIVLISKSGTTLQIDEITLAHELVHALQDQHYDLGGFDDRLRDEANAESGLIEGDARYVDYLYRGTCSGGAWNGTCAVPEKRGSGDLANVGVYFVKYMPYSAGPAFVQRLRNEGGWEAVNAAYDAPPKSSEQVIHPERYGTDEPTNVSLSDRSAESWSRVKPDGRPDFAELGEGALASMFAYPTFHGGDGEGLIPRSEWLNATAEGQTSEFAPIGYETNYTDGWDGDKLYVYENDAGETAYVWRLAWDSPADAREFVEGYRRLLGYWGATRVGENTYRIPEGEPFADAFHVEANGTSVTITNAPTVPELSAVNGDVEAADASNTTTAGAAG